MIIAAHLDASGVVAGDDISLIRFLAADSDARAESEPYSIRHGSVSVHIGADEIAHDGLADGCGADVRGGRLDPYIVARDQVASSCDRTADRGGIGTVDICDLYSDIRIR